MRRFQITRVRILPVKTKIRIRAIPRLKTLRYVLKIFLHFFSPTKRLLKYNRVFLPTVRSVQTRIRYNDLRLNFSNLCTVQCALYRYRYLCYRIYFLTPLRPFPFQVLCKIHQKKAKDMIPRLVSVTWFKVTPVR